MSSDPRCPFCQRIERGEYDYHDKHSVAFHPLNPVTPGHFLVMPRKHVTSALEPVAPILLGDAMRLAAILARQMDLTDCNFINSAGALATQTVFHLHVHVVPRRDGDGLALPWTGQEQPAGARAEVSAAPAGYRGEGVRAALRKALAERGAARRRAAGRYVRVADRAAAGRYRAGMSRRMPPDSDGA